MTLHTTAGGGIGGICGISSRVLFLVLLGGGGSLFFFFFSFDF